MYYYKLLIKSNHRDPGLIYPPRTAIPFERTSRRSCMATQSGSIASRASTYLDRSDAPSKTVLRPAAVLAGRVLFSLIFLLAAVGHFSPQEIVYAAQQGVPLASLAVPVSGVLALLGGLSVLVDE